MNKIIIRRILAYFEAFRESRPATRGTGNTPHEAIGHLFCVEAGKTGSFHAEYDMLHEYTNGYVVMNGIEKEIV